MGSRPLRSCLLALSAAGLLLSAQPSLLAAQSPCRNAAIRSPFRGDTLQGRVPVLGSARIDDFNFYKLEWAPAADPENWSAVSNTKPDFVVNGLLDEWDTTHHDDGEYRLKLTVVDSLHQEVCRVTVSDLTIANHRAPTPTPPPTEVTRATAVPRLTTDGEEAPGADTPAPNASLVPNIPRSTPSTVEDMLSPATWLSAVRVGEWAPGFVQGFAVTWVLALLVLALRALRRR